MGALLRYSCRWGSYYSEVRTNRGGHSNRGSTVGRCIIFKRDPITKKNRRSQSLITHALPTLSSNSLYLEDNPILKKKLNL